jgi:hypothetical protein
MGTAEFLVGAALQAANLSPERRKVKTLLSNFIISEQGWAARKNGYSCLE